MAKYACYTSWSVDELKAIYYNKDSLNVADQPETWAILGRSISSMKLIHKLRGNEIKFVIENEKFYVKIVIDEAGDLSYSLSLPYIDVPQLEDNAINLMAYLKGSTFYMQIGEKYQYKQDYFDGTLSQEFSRLLKQHLPNMYNVISLGVLVNPLNGNDIIFSAGYIMLFDTSIDKQTLVQVFSKIPRVTKLLVDYQDEKSLQSFLMTKIEEEMMKTNI